MKTRLSVLAAVAGAFLTTTANSTVFYIDQFIIDKNGNDWFDDPFEDGFEPPSSENQVPGGTQAGYRTKPDPMPGPEENGRLTLNTAEGEPSTSKVTGNPLLTQRARLATNTSDHPDDLDKGLKSGHTFEVTGVYDLIRPEIRYERYGIRLTDSKDDRYANDNVQLGVVLSGQDEWLVRFREADIVDEEFDVLDSYNLSNRADIAIFEQIALTLSKPVASSTDITASFELIDDDDPSNNEVIGLSGNPSIFDGESWTRADFVAVQVVPVPAALPLMGSALGLMGLIAFKRRRLTT